MTESEWLTSDDAGAMLDWLGGATETVRTRWHGPVEVRRWRVSETKLWLFLAAAHRCDAEALLTDAGWRILEALGDWACGLLAQAGLMEAVERQQQREQGEASLHVSTRGALARDNWSALERLVALCRRAGGPFEPTLPPGRPPGRHAALLREVVGNPFRMPVVGPHWLSANDGAARHLAEVIATSRDFSVLPVLADALEDAGCRDESLLGHLRGPGPHVRGCWALGLVLGRKP